MPAELPSAARQSSSPSREQSTQPDARNIRRHRARLGSSRRLIVFFHGFGLYAQKFDDLVAMLTDAGHDVVTFDALGHGEGDETRVDVQSIETVVAESIAVYERFASEHPFLMGVGVFGGLQMRRVIERSCSSDWIPPAIFYSVDYVNAPTSMLRFLRARPRWLAFLDRFVVGYDVRALTHDADANLDFIERDPRASSTLRLGMALYMAAETNAFYDLPSSDDAPHAFLIGTEDTLSHLPPMERVGSRQPDFRLWKVEGGRMHMHRDTPAVQARFRRALAEALDFLESCVVARSRSSAA